MATYHGLIPGLPFISVDNFKTVAEVYLLSHFHADHYVGLHNNFDSGMIYCSSQTAHFIFNRFPELSPSVVVPLKYHKEYTIRKGETTVALTLVPSNHCSGSVMFILEGPAGTCLHTGDLRWDPQLKDDPVLKTIAKAQSLHHMFLDTTFCSPFWKEFPTKEESITQVLDIINSYPTDTQVYLECEMIGTECIFEAISREYSLPISADRATASKFACIPWIQANNVITTDSDITRFHIRNRKSKETNAKLSKKRKISERSVYIRPSTQWFANRPKVKEAVSTKPCKSGHIWHVLLSLHSSFVELIDFVSFLQPKNIRGITECNPSSLRVLKKYMGKNNNAGTLEREEKEECDILEDTSSVEHLYPHKPSKKELQQSFLNILDLVEEEVRMKHASNSLI